MGSRYIDSLLGPDDFTLLRTEFDLVEEVWNVDWRMPPGDAEVLLACWESPLIDEEALEAMPSLRAVVFAAGSVKGTVTDAVFERGIKVSSGASTNAEPVAEYTLAMILLAGKDVFRQREAYRSGALSPARTTATTVGNYGLTVGIVGASRIGRRVIELLRPFDVNIMVTDPTLGAPLDGTSLVPLDVLMAGSDVVSVHAPAIPDTDRMIGREMLSRMRSGATLINTARGCIVDEEALIDELQSGRLFGILDVTGEEPPNGDQRLLASPHAFVTPHLAGSQGRELRRLGRRAVQELQRYKATGEFAHEVRRSSLRVSA